MDDFEKELEIEIRLELQDNLRGLSELLNENHGNWAQSQFMEQVLRLMHSAKGNSNAAGFIHHAKAMHGLEDAFFNIRDKNMVLETNQKELILDFVADFNEVVEKEVATQSVSVESAQLPDKLEELYLKIFSEDDMEVQTPFSALVVDDNLDFLEVFSESLMLEFPDWHLRAAENGKIALEITQHQNFDLILTDYFMPEMNGNKFIEGVRKDSKNIDTPIVMVTAFKPEFEDNQKMWENVFFMEKPINWKRLKFIINCMSKTNKAS